MDNDKSSAPTVTAPPPRRPRGAPREPDVARRPGTSELSLREVAETLLGARWLILGCTLGALALALGYLFVARPVYRSSALLEVDDAANAMAVPEPLRPVPEKETRDGDIQRMRTRSVVGRVVDRLGLAVVAEPRRLPVLGDALARRYRGTGPAPAPLGFLSRYGFGGERIATTVVDVPEELAGVPMTLVALESSRYRLLDGGGKPLAEGEVGIPAAPAPGAPAFDFVVSALAARPGTQFRIVAERRNDVIDALQARLAIVEKGRKTGLIDVSLDGDDPRRITEIVSALVSEYMKQNTARRKENVATTLGLVQGQLAALKARLEAAEAALGAFKAKEGMADMAVQTRVAIEQIAEMQRALSDVEAERSQLGSHRTDRHPDMSALEAKAAGIRSSLAALDDRVRALPATELRYARLGRDVTVATEQYVSMLDRIQVLQVIRAGENGNVRVVDAAVVPHRPIAPKPPIAIAVALLLGLGGGIAAAFVRRSLVTGRDDSQAIEAATGLPIFVTIPHSDVEAKLQREARGKARASLAEAAPEDVATESLRTMRTVLGFLLKARGNVVAVSSPAPGSGKTFVAANLAHLLAAAGKRVLLVDADLRRGTLHRYFALEESPGLSDVLGGATLPDAATRRTGTAGLDVLTCGRAAPHPAELLASARFDEVMSALSKRYDVVIVDTAPTLAVTDAVLVGRCAGLNLLVLRSRHEPVREISLALERFARSGVQVHGAIVNDARPGGRYARSYEHRTGSSETPVVALDS